jgi:anaerobic magnesium-protoporphyrin IX monomethyl ester cyclase
MTDILLVQPPVHDFYLTAKRTIPYGLACIASALMDEGFTVEILDGLATRRSRIIELPVEMAYLREFYGKPDISPFALFHHFRHYGRSFGYIGEAAARSKAFLVGISSLFTAYADEAIRTAEAVKDALPQAWVAVGGHHATELPEAVMRSRAVDFVLRGEGEASMPVLAKTLREGGDMSSVPGIVYRTGGGGITIGAPAIMEDLDSRPLPAVHLLDRRFYKRGSRGSAVVVSSRGCPLHCTYCSTGASSFVRYRRRSVARVLREIEEAIREDGVGFIDFEDENISMDRRWFLELLHGIEELTGGNGVELRAMNGIFPSTLDEEIIRTMKEAGFKALNLSLGTISCAQLRAFGRPDVRSSFDESVACATRYGLSSVGYIIVGAPSQDPVDSVSDLLYLAERDVLAGVSVYYPAPGSVDFARCREAGILPSEFSLMRSTALPISDVTTREDSVTLLRLGRILNFIKSLSENDFPDGGTQPVVWTPQARREAGLILLRSFLRDGAVLGLTPERESFRHRTSERLCEAFRTGILRIPAIVSKIPRLLPS